MGQTWWETISCTLGSSIIIIHIVALIFLKISKYSNRHKNQVLIITSLSILELTGTVLLIGYFLFTYFELLVMADIAFRFYKNIYTVQFSFYHDIAGHWNIFGILFKTQIFALFFTLKSAENNSLLRFTFPVDYCYLCCFDFITNNNLAANVWCAVYFVSYIRC